MVALPSGSVEVEAKLAVRSVVAVVKPATGGAFGAFTVTDWDTVSDSPPLSVTVRVTV